MKKLKSILCTMLIAVILLSNIQVFAAESLIDVAGEVQITEEFQNWVKLSDEEKEDVLPPRSIEVFNSGSVSKNPISVAQTASSATLSKFTLQDYIPENLVIKDQKSTSSCWTFASLGMLESTLALSNYYNNKTLELFDFSERHMEYSTTRVFANGEINYLGLNRKVGSGGNYFTSMPYMLSGRGPIKEADMPFEDNEDEISLSEIQNKETVAQIQDTIIFPSYDSDDDKTQIIKDVKSHIKKYGGVEALVNGASLFSDSYNLKTGAMFTSDATKNPVDHDVILVGWDDNYSVENFNENNRPKNNGAWIIKNSWGKEQRLTSAEMKETIFAALESDCIAQGWNSAEEIPTDKAEQLFEGLGYTIINGEAVLEIGKDGFMYLSYEDANVYSGLIGIEKATSEVTYDNIYLYDEQGAIGNLPLSAQIVYIASTFEKKTDETEYLTEVGVNVPETSVCKVWLNPNGTSHNKSDLVHVKLKAGDTETFDSGYHTLEFLKPVEIKSENFTVVLELKGTKTDTYNVAIELKYEDSNWSTVQLEEKKSYWTTSEFIDKNEWIDFSELATISSGKIPNGDITIKAFTVNDLPEATLEKIEITTPPTKTEYKVGEDFDKTGMVVTATFNDGSTKEITDYTIQNGTELKEDQTVVMIEYQDKVVTQTIKVETSTTDDGNEDDGTGEDKPADGTEGEKPDDGTEDDKTDDEKTNPEATDFSKVDATVEKVKAFYFTNKNTKEYITIDLILDEIKRSEKNDTSEYYYYLSSSPSKTGIKDWVKITEKQTATDKLDFTINTKDINNYTEVLKATNLYLYIKEVVTKDTEELETITKAILIETKGKVEVYKDNVKQTENSNGTTNNNNNNNNQTNNSSTTTEKDDTTSKNILPAAGLKIGVGILIFAIAIFGLIKLNQYRKMNF